MIVYSMKILRFLREIKKMVADVLSEELHFRVGKDRFYAQENRFSYPIRIVIYNHRAMLGYFDPNFYELGFHECLMQSSLSQLKNVIRHEIAHYIVFIENGERDSPHGHTFKEFCKKAGWGEEVYRATSCLDGGEDLSCFLEKSILRKVQKLMALAESSSPNESEQAMIKSRQLLLKHNIELQEVQAEEKIVLKRVLKQKREDAKMRSIAKILSTFFIHVIFRKGKDFTCLEILGDLVNVEIGEYVAIYLEKELDSLWEKAQRNTSLKGLIAKNSFFLGVAKGYCNKIEALKKEYPADTEKALVLMEKKLFDAKNMVYPRLFSSKSHFRYCEASANLGERAGKSLQIHPAVEKSSGRKMIELL